MSLGGVTATIVTGGGQSTASGADLAKTVIGLGVSTDGVPGTLYHPGSSPGMRSALGSGPLPEGQALLWGVQGAPSPYALVLEPSNAGDIGTVTHTGTGTGTISASAAPHLPIEGEITTGGALGTMAGRYRVNGGSWINFTSSAGGSFVLRVRGTFCKLTFPSATYTGSETFSVGVSGTITSSGAAATPATVTSAVGPFDFRGLGSPNLRIAFNAGGDQDVAITAAAATKAGSGAAGNYPITGTFDVTFSGGAKASVSVVAAADAADMANQVNAQINGGSAVVNGNEVDLVSDRKGTTASVTVASAACAGFTNGSASGSGTVANDAAVTASELAAICAGITNGTATASGGALVLTSALTGVAGTAQVKAASTADTVMGGEFATNVVKQGAAAGAIAGLSQASSPVDRYDLQLTVGPGGALGTAAISVSLDGGETQYGPPLLTPAGGTVVIPGTGIVLSCAGTFVEGDLYEAPCAPPYPSVSDITDAIAAAVNDATSPASATLEIGHLPNTAASAFTLAEALQTALDAAFVAGKDWRAIVTCPLAGEQGKPGDVVIVGGNAVADTADTRTVVKAARSGVVAPRVDVFAGTDWVQSAIGSYQVRRPRSTSFAPRLAGKLPVEKDRSTIATRDAALGVAKIGSDERFASVSLYDAQVNTYQTVQGLNGAYLTIGRGLYGWQSLSTDANLIDSDGFRAVCAILAGFRPVAAKIVGRRYPINADGTIEAKTRGGLDDLLNGAINKVAGFGASGDFGGVPQVSQASAYVNPASNLGPAGDKVVRVIASILPLGFASAVSIELQFQGA